MELRPLGRTGFQVSAVSFGAWAVGGAWGSVDDRESLAALHRAVDLGVNFFDTADVYGDGRSERLLATLRRERREPIVIATKAGRRLPKQIASGYNRENLTAFVDRSLAPLLSGVAFAAPVWLLPLRDLMSVAVLVGGFVGSRVDWRGHALDADGPVAIPPTRLTLNRDMPLP